MCEAESLGLGRLLDCLGNQRYIFGISDLLLSARLHSISKGSVYTSRFFYSVTVKTFSRMKRKSQVDWSKAKVISSEFPAHFQTFLSITGSHLTHNYWAVGEHLPRRISPLIQTRDRPNLVCCVSLSKWWYYLEIIKLETRSLNQSFPSMFLWLLLKCINQHPYISWGEIYKVSIFYFVKTPFKSSRSYLYLISARYERNIH